MKYAKSACREAHSQDKAHIGDAEVSKGWITLKEAQAIKPDFRPGWTLDPETGNIVSRFGKVEQRVQLKPDGMPDFDRMVYFEAPNINAVVWGRGRFDGQIYIGRTVQARPLADRYDGQPADPPIIFVQPCVMGFNLLRVAGVESALREAAEEAGVATEGVLSIEQMRFHNPNPTFCATWSELFDIQVDLEKVTDQTDRSELIYKAEYVPLRQAIEDIGRGWDNGVSYRSATANDALFVWIARHPEFMAMTYR